MQRLILPLLLSACADPMIEAHPLDPTEQSIYYGTADTNPAHMAVVALTDTSYGFFCSGTLIASDVVLTAGHCLEGASRYSTEIFFGSSVYESGTTRGVDDMLIHRDYNGQSVSADIGLIRLSSDAPANIAPIPHLPAALGLTSNDVGETVDFSGFGATETGSDGDKLHVEGTISGVCAGPSTCGDTAARAFDYAQGNGGPCSGDSGGPAFLFRGAEEYVAGITSYGDWNCTDYGVSTTVSAYADWIEAFIGGGSVPAENCANGIDDDGDGLTDCDDSNCSAYSECIGPNACESPTVVTCGANLSGTTLGGSTAFYTNGCAASASSRWEGPEVGYELNVTAGANVTVELQPSSGDLDLFLLPGASGGCDLDGCLTSSMEEGSSNEVISFTMPSSRMFVMVDTWDSASGFSLMVTCSGGTTPPEDCDNGADDDEDGSTDCFDSDCVGDPACQITPTEICGNGIDDDDDGYTDCADSDCAAGCPTHTTTAATPRGSEIYGSGGCAGVTGTPAVLAALLLLRRRRR